MTINDIPCFITSHGRPNACKTANTLLKNDYKGTIYIVLDNEDSTAEEYKKLYENVVIFNKDEYVAKFNSFLTQPLRNIVAHARNAVEDIAPKLGYKQWIVCDDDITSIKLYTYSANENKIVKERVPNINDILIAYAEYLQEAKITTIGLGTENFWLGGQTTMFEKPYHNHYRLCSNIFLRNFINKVDWFPDMFEDIGSAVHEGRKGNVLMSLPWLSTTAAVQGGKKSSSDSGMSTTYLQLGNYGVSIFPVCALPDCYHVTGTKLWFACKDYNTTVPKIISNKYKC